MTKSAEITLNKKLRLERRLYTQMRSIFDDMASKSSNQSFHASSYESQIGDALFSHYGDVGNIFIRDYRKSNGVVMQELQEKLLVGNYSEFIATKAKEQSERITATNIKQHAQVLEALDKMEVSLITPRVRQNIYRRFLYGRLNGISCYETQWVAESAKQAEIAYLIGSQGITIKGFGDASKRWDSQGDDITRGWHLDADSQVVDCDDPFRVNGEYLMYPGDRTLGATIGNLINCRCSAYYHVNIDLLTAGKVSALLLESDAFASLQD